MTEPNELIYARAKLVCDKIGALHGNRNSKPGWEIRGEGQTKKLPTKMKVTRKEKLV